MFKYSKLELELQQGKVELFEFVVTLIKVILLPCKCTLPAMVQRDLPNGQRGIEGHLL